MCACSDPDPAAGTPCTELLDLGPCNPSIAHRHRASVVDLTTTLAGSASGTPAFADGTGTAASFNRPSGVAVSPDGGTLYRGDFETLASG
ncbi:hypothetical protein EMIHUDRAFT_258974 [Emiliania huxleyi CCMP1516]|uniref:SMP-30/Gluconolactonase/LRE-like region domain-containing protein n=2 Tax=Emiliania huxleyi TaxID=2903 RepID=A0A0D3I4T0_EMIH1|nr:hypothetical protein EMIHUDRAFT_258974 [Emiliania huxleyi CCMP1516]EOD06265.1 hypothetical protein EMIHUDRAFT_258974 [Emiliania huxleyi CCMP1516]|eukprot:XP_005758694.1 hypothetical protein EMIHUDRAFT_258974 [Emiliania huxleyi CCMP1516]